MLADVNMTKKQLIHYVAGLIFYMTTHAYYGFIR